MSKVLKYKTGEEVPRGSEYITSKTETVYEDVVVTVNGEPITLSNVGVEYLYHYFLVSEPRERLSAEVLIDTEIVPNRIDYKDNC